MKKSLMPKAMSQSHSLSYRLHLGSMSLWNSRRPSEHARNKPDNLLSHLAANFGGMRALTACLLLAQCALASENPVESIHLRDPFILPVEQERSYYLVASGGRSVTVRQSEDLKTWGEPKTVFAIPENFWGGDALWAPEIHEYRGRYYLLATFMNKHPIGVQWTNWPPRVHRGTQVLAADSPLGPFNPFAMGSENTPSVYVSPPHDGTIRLFLWRGVGVGTNGCKPVPLLNQCFA